MSFELREVERPGTCTRAAAGRHEERGCRNSLDLDLSVQLDKAAAATEHTLMLSARVLKH